MGKPVTTAAEADASKTAKNPWKGIKNEDIGDLLETVRERPLSWGFQRTKRWFYGSKSLVP